MGDYPTLEDAAEEIRKKYLYRQLILSGKIKLPHKRAAQLVGPDCLYQLYALQKPGLTRRRRSQSRKRARQRPSPNQ